MYLAIDTSTNTAGLAIIANRCLIAEETWRCVRNHSVELLPHLVSLLTKARVDLPKITGVVIALGPGGFNGLRVGLGTAKGLAFGLDLPLVGVSTLAAAAYQCYPVESPVCAVLPAGRTEVAWAVYQASEEKWQNVFPENISNPDDICSYVNIPTIITGEADDELVQQICIKLGGLAITPPHLSKSRVHALAELGDRKSVV